MIPKNTKAIILYLLRNLKLININQISRKLKISVGSAFKILKELEINKLIISHQLGNAKFYQIITSLLNIGELYLYFTRNYGEKEAINQIGKISFKILEITKEDIIQSCKFKLEHQSKKFSWADCVGYTLSNKFNLKFLTGDEEFKGLNNVEYVKN